MIKWPEPVKYEYRWINPDGGEQPASMLEWKGIEPSWNQTVAQKCGELLAYRYKGEPVYEVRSLITESQLKQAVRDALEGAAKACQKLEVAIDGGGNTYYRPADARQCVAAIRALIKEIPE